MPGERLLVRGQVQGVGFRPTVWRIANDMRLTGDVKNTGTGVEIRVWGPGCEGFAERLGAELPVLARIDALERWEIDVPAPEDFRITASLDGEMHAAIMPDVATCPECLAEIRDPSGRRYRYPFTNCTNCGPRFSFVRGAPYDRARTTMRSFPMCDACRREYEDPGDRRFHAQPIACPDCGPNAWLEPLGGDTTAELGTTPGMDAVAAAGVALINRFIVAVKGIGGVNLACDATMTEVVERLRARKRRRGKAFALMARDLDVVADYAEISTEEACLLRNPAAPIALLKAKGMRLPDAVAPGLTHLGFMLPYTPLHQLLLRPIDRPVVMTSGNIAGQPQCTANRETREHLSEVADFALLHDRAIANRIDDSVVRIDLGRPRLLRRARGYAPAPIALPAGFDRKTQVLAMGAELKNAFCIVKDGQAVLSQHMGDLEDAATYEDVARNLELYTELYQHNPSLLAVDRHPDYLSTKRGFALAGDRPTIEVQHHHAHVAACLAENGRALDAAPVLGIAMDGLGLGDDGTIWGGEFLVCDYRRYRRAGCLKPVALPGGAAAVREPWRCAYAHLTAAIGWTALATCFSDLELYRKLDIAPRRTLDAMIASGTNAPLASSCGRLFDAAAAVTGLAWEAQAHEGEAAMHFEAAIDMAAIGEPDERAYPFTTARLGGSGLSYLEPVDVWRAILRDLRRQTPAGLISARFHRGLAHAIVGMARRIAAETAIDTVALSGGCFQNATLFGLVHEGLEAAGFGVLSHAAVPANDGGLALGQAAVALALHQEEG